MLSQHGFKIYGADKDKIEIALTQLKEQGIICSFRYTGLEASGYLNSTTNVQSNTINNMEYKQLSNKDISDVKLFQEYMQKEISKQLGVPSKYFE